MAKTSKKKALDAAQKNERPIAENRKARREYEVLDTLECGIVLVGSEVKSLRKGTLSLDEAYGRIKDGEVWLINCDIAEYVQANQFNHDAKRPRKLLLHRREIKKFASKAYEQGLTLVPLKMYFKEGRAKVLLGHLQGTQAVRQARSAQEENHATRHQPRPAPGIAASASERASPKCQRGPPATTTMTIAKTSRPAASGNRSSAIRAP